MSKVREKLDSGGQQPTYKVKLNGFLNYLTPQADARIRKSLNLAFPRPKTRRSRERKSLFQPVRLLNDFLAVGRGLNQRGIKKLLHAGDLVTFDGEYKRVIGIVS